MNIRSAKAFFLTVLIVGAQLLPISLQAHNMSQIRGAQQRKAVRHMRQMVIDPVLGMPIYMNNLMPLVEMNEYNELQLDDVVKHLDCAQTSFGTWGFKQRMIPLANRTIVDQRIAHTQHLVENEQLYATFERLLEDIWKLEPELLAYFDKDMVMMNIKKLYYDIPFVKQSGLLNSFKNFLNHNSVALEGAFYVDSAKAAISFGKVFMVKGVLEEFVRWQYNTDADKSGFDIKRAIKRSASQIIRDHNPRLDVLKNGYDPKADDSYAKFMKSLFDGSLGDRYKVMSEWYTFDDSINLFFKEISLKTRPTSEYSKPMQALWKTMAAPGALFQTLWNDYDLYLNAKSAFGKVNFLRKVNSQLKERMVKVARFVRTAQKISQFVSRDPQLRNSPIAQNFARVFGKRFASQKLQKALKLLNSSTFNANSSVYMRGRMLLAHKLLQEVKEELVPMLQAIGELDATMSVARIYKQHVGQLPTFTFVQFDDSTQTVVDIQDGWIATLSANNPVVNDIEIGGAQQNHFLLTGPNGAGKSTVLKMVGQIVGLGHSIGLVPASYARMSFFNGMRTSLEPSEDLKKGLSSFMAEHKSMDEIYSFISESAPDKKCLVLIDEPFRGTVSHETARLDGKFCSFVTDLPHVLTGIATHIMPDLKKPKAWAFYNMEIQDALDGQFARTYKLRSGKADWWFNNAERRGRYVDWLGNYKKVK